MSADHLADQAKALKSVGIFQGLKPEQLSLVIARMELVERKSGELLFAEGAAGEELYIVLKGAVLVIVTLSDGKELVISEIKSGNFFGEMSIIERAPRSAACRVAEDSVLLGLHADDFNALMVNHPEIGVIILRRMINITVDRLLKTNSFLSQLVQWGETARKRAITDEATGLFNRRFHDESLENLIKDAVKKHTKLGYAMFDLDHFGDLNKKYGLAFGDKVIVEIAKVMKTVFGKDDLLVRYGGDEFTFLFPGQDVDAAFAKTDSLRQAIAALRLSEQPELSFTCSLGLAVCPDHAAEATALMAAADKALYRAKETGRNRVMVSGDNTARGLQKRDLRSIAEMNRIIRNFIRVLDEKDDFLLVGHANPDEDCLASLVAFGLLTSKMNKRATIFLRSKPHGQYAYLLAISRYNSITVLENQPLPEGRYSVVVAMDTPKPSLLDLDDSVRAVLADPTVIRMEVDHHLQADAEYFGDEGYRLVATASSSCELIGYLAYKASNNNELLSRYGITDLFTRNLVLAILTGIIADSKMGKYLKTKRERWFYQWFSNLFDQMLAQKTLSGSKNFASKEDVFRAIESMSASEDACFNKVMELHRSSVNVDFIVMDRVGIDTMSAYCGREAFITVVKSATDALAERNGRLGMVAFPDAPDVSDLYQFRLRRSLAYDKVDLRGFLERNGFTNGGGHPGAIGFRLPQSQVPNPESFVADLVEKINRFVAEAEAASTVAASVAR